MTTLKIEKVNGKVGMFVIGLFVLLPLLVFVGSYGISEQLATGKAESALSPPALEAGAPANKQKWLSPAAAMTDEKPTLLLFLPYEMCQIRYCPQPELVDERLAQQVGDQVNFVPVTVHPIPAVGANRSEPHYKLENWDLYPVPPYNTWLPVWEETQFGLSLSAPVYTLVDSSGAVLYQGTAFPYRVLLSMA